MIKRLSYLGVWSFTALVVTPGIVSCAKELHPTVHRVPESQSEEYKNIKAPFEDALAASAEILAEGKHLYEGKGSCYMCHGSNGKGDGPAGRIVKPAPRNLTDCKFQKTREDGELFWIIKYGSRGTGMVGVVPGVLSEEDAWKIVAYLRSFCKA
jgi:mono/diheme cytochrome c family protein